MTRSKLVSWLSQPAGKFTDTDFQPIVRGIGSSVGAPAAATSDLQKIPHVKDRPLNLPSTRGAGERPLLIVLPGIMGSHLAVGQDHVWMNMESIMLGGMARLEFGKEKVSATNVVAENYERLCQYLATSYEVEPFAYDWRDSVEISAGDLAKRIEQDKIKRPIRIVAHSMGGLVARMMIEKNPELWKRLCDRGGRLVMLGTPNGGSYVIPRLLFGLDEMVRMLDQADALHSAIELSRFIASFPGVLEMLPASNGIDFFKHSWWAGLKALPFQHLKRSWPPQRCARSWHNRQPKRA